MMLMHGRDFQILGNELKMEMLQGSGHAESVLSTHGISQRTGRRDREDALPDSQTSSFTSLPLHALSGTGRCNALSARC